MKKINKVIEVIFVCVAVILSVSCGSSGALGLLGKSTVKVGPVTLTVVEVVNGENKPINKITVYYVLKTSRLSLMSGSSEFDIIDVMKLETDSSGEVHVPAKSYSIPNTHDFSSRSFYINLDTKSVGMPTADDFNSFFNVIFFNQYYEYYNNVIFVNTDYGATGVGIFDHNSPDERYDRNDHFIMYEKYTPFIEREVGYTVELIKK